MKAKEIKRKLANNPEAKKGEENEISRRKMKAGEGEGDY